MKAGLVQAVADAAGAGGEDVDVLLAGVAWVGAQDLILVAAERPQLDAARAAGHQRVLAAGHSLFERRAHGRAVDADVDLSATKQVDRPQVDAVLGVAVNGHPAADVVGVDAAVVDLRVAGAAANTVFAALEVGDV